MFDIFLLPVLRACSAAGASAQVVYNVPSVLMFFIGRLILTGAVYFFKSLAALTLGLIIAALLRETEEFTPVFLNFLLSSNFLAFVLAFYLRTRRQFRWSLVVFVLLVLAFCAFIQGVKSRIFYFAIFFRHTVVECGEIDLKRAR